MLKKIRSYLNGSAGPIAQILETQRQIAASVNALNKAHEDLASRVFANQTQLMSSQSQTLDTQAQILSNQSQGLNNHRDMIDSTNRLLAAGGTSDGRVSETLKQVMRNQQIISDQLNHVLASNQIPDQAISDSLRQVLENQSQILKTQTLITEKIGIASRDLSTPGDLASLSAMDAIYDRHGVLVSTAEFSDDARRDIALYHPYRARAECALDVCSMYSQGDYFEFGSDGMSTFRNFLTAFDIFDLPTTLPDTRFYAFDVFGKVDESKNLPEFSKTYFDAWKDEGHDKLQEAHDHIASHGIMADNCYIVPGYFEDTLTQERKQKHRNEKRWIAFAFIDCNITPSYELVFEFIFDLMAKTSFIYMDEYFINSDVPGLYQKFCERLRDERGLESHYMRNAGSFGALFRILPRGKFDTPSH